MKIHVIRTLVLLFCLVFTLKNAKAEISECLDALEPYKEAADKASRINITSLGDMEEMKKLTELINQEIDTEIAIIRQEIELAYYEPELVGQYEKLVEQRKRLIFQREVFIRRRAELIKQQQAWNQLSNPTPIGVQTLDVGKQVLKRREELIDKRIKLISRHIKLIRQPNVADQLRGGYNGLIDRRIKLIKRRIELITQQIIELVKLKSNLITIQQEELNKQQSAALAMQNSQLSEQKANAKQKDSKDINPTNTIKDSPMDTVDAVEPRTIEYIEPDPKGSKTNKK